MADNPDLDAWNASLPNLAIAIDEMQRARREAEQQPPHITTITAPEFPRPGVARFPCPLECGWHHDESTDPGPAGPILLPADFTTDDLNAALTSQSEVRSNNLRLRVEQAITDHFAADHPGR